MRKVILFLLSLYLLPAQAIEPLGCRNGYFPHYKGKVELAQVIANGKEKVNFRDDSEGCPNKASCIQKAYLVNGDKILVSEKDRDWVCGWYFGKTREFVGWLPAKNVKYVSPEKVPQPQDWLGVWKPIAGDNEIRIRLSKTKGKLDVDGNATWLGALLDSGERVVHVGEFEGSASPDGMRLTIGNADEEYECVVKFQWVQGNLIVSDNNNCGGMNVSFSGVYRSQKGS